MKIRNRHEILENEKCPVCLMIFQHFIEVAPGLLACRKCGCVHLDKETRNTVDANILEIIKSQEKASEEVSNETVIHLAKCGFEAKTAAGVAAHERRCETCLSMTAAGDERT